MPDTHAMPDVQHRSASHKFDADTYYKMGEAGILASHERVELINGDVLDMAPIGQDHEGATNDLNTLLVFAFGANGIVSVQNSLRLDNFKVPQPDFVVLRPRADRYRTGSRPSPVDALLLIEVSDSSLEYDSTIKLALYAEAGIAEYWIVNLRQKIVEAHRQPGPDGYADRTEHTQADTLTPVLAPSVRIPLQQVFG